METLKPLTTQATDGDTTEAETAGGPVATGGNAGPAHSVPFSAFGISEAICSGLAAAGIVTTFPIQALTLPFGLRGQDIIGQARTGTGKTLAFGIPLLQLIEQGATGSPSALVVVPTRELAIQVADDLRTAAVNLRVRVLTVYGGRAYEPQINALTAGVDIVVGTPGRLLDLVQRRHLDLSAVRSLVLDEADKMLDLGFLPDVERIVRLTPADRLTMVFCPTKRAADQVASALATRGFAVATVHGDLGQSQRERALRAFRSGKVDVLTATEVAARGLDVDDVTHVVNYECPDDDMTYVHRIGRTGRAGKAGVAVTFVDWRDMHRWKLINDALGLGRPEPVETYSTSEHLYTELDIPREVTGTLPRAMRERAGLEAEVLEDIGETGRIRSPRARKATAATGSGGRARRSRSRREGQAADGQAVGGQAVSGQAASGQGQAAGETGQQHRTRRRRRTRAGRELGADQQAAAEFGRRPASEAPNALQPNTLQPNVRPSDAGQPEAGRDEATRRKAS